MTGEQAVVAAIPMSDHMIHALSTGWSEPMQIKIAIRDTGPELVFRSVSWKRLEPQPETVS